MNTQMNILLPPATIGIVGGGQLGRMLSFEAKRMGYRVIVLDPTPGSPAGQVSDGQITASFQDADAICRLAKTTDVLTYEFEHINADILCNLEREGYHVYPSGFTLKKIQNKYLQKKILCEAGLPVPEFVRINTLQDMENAADSFGVPLVIKTCVGGYDGKGNYIVKDRNELALAYESMGSGSIPLMAEEFVDFSCELSIMVARDKTGQNAYFPIADNRHETSILRVTKVPASIHVELEEKIKAIACSVMNVLNDVGVFCIEMFAARNGQLYINEIAPRPHNSGHYTIEATVTSQYEQQLRAITGLPLGSTKLLSPVVMLNVLGSENVEGSYRVKGLEHILKEEGVYPHLYGKISTNPLKKIGHITVLGSTMEEAENKAARISNILDIVPYEEV